MDRRSFLKATGAPVAAAALLPAIINKEDLEDFTWKPLLPEITGEIDFPVLLLDRNGRILAEKTTKAIRSISATGMEFRVPGDPPHKIYFGEAPPGDWDAHSWGTYIGSLIGSDSRGIKTLGLLDAVILHGNTLTLEFGSVLAVIA